MDADARYELPCRVGLLIGSALNWVLAIMMGRDLFGDALPASTYAALTAVRDVFTFF